MKVGAFGCISDAHSSKPIVDCCFAPTPLRSCGVFSPTPAHAYYAHCTEGAHPARFGNKAHCSNSSDQVPPCLPRVLVLGAATHSPCLPVARAMSRRGRSAINRRRRCDYLRTTTFVHHGRHLQALPAVFARTSEAQRWLQDHVSPAVHSERASCEKSRFSCRLCTLRALIQVVPTKAFSLLIAESFVTLLVLRLPLRCLDWGTLLSGELSSESPELPSGLPNVSVPRRLIAERPRLLIALATGKQGE